MGKEVKLPANARLGEIAERPRQLGEKACREGGADVIALSPGGRADDGFSCPCLQGGPDFAAKGYIVLRGRIHERFIELPDPLRVASGFDDARRKLPHPSDVASRKVPVSFGQRRGGFVHQRGAPLGERPREARGKL